MMEAHPENASPSSAARLQKQIARLAAWEREHGPISDSRLRATPDGLSIINALANLRRGGDLGGSLSPLEEAARLGGLVVQRRQENHDVESTVVALDARFKSELPCRVRDLEADPAWRKRYNSIRKYHGWDDVVCQVLRRLPNARPTDFYDSLPDLRWHIVELTGDLCSLDEQPDGDLCVEALENRIVATVNAFCARYGNFTRSVFEHHPVGGKLHSYIGNLERRRQMRGLYQRVMSRVYAGKAPRVSRSGSLSWSNTSHDVQCDPNGEPSPHGLLGSPFEVLVDDAFALALGEDVWVKHHRHHVSLVQLVPNASRRLNADIVIADVKGGVVCTVEVGAGDLARKPSYKESRRRKRTLLRRVGISQVDCDLVGGKAASVQALAATVVRVAGLIGIRLTLERTEAAITNAALRLPGRSVTFSRDELAEFLRSRGVDTQEEYKRARAELIAAGDSVAPFLPALGKRLFDRFGCSWYELRGASPQGSGSGRARQKHPAFALYDDYDEARQAARTGGFKDNKDYRNRRQGIDPRLPVDPERHWPVRFAADGWPGFLGTGPSNDEVARWVTQEDLRFSMRISHRALKRRLMEGRLTPTARRVRRGYETLYFDVEAVVAFGRSLPGAGFDERTVRGMLITRVRRRQRELRRRSRRARRMETS